MSDYLVFRLYAPLASWGEAAVGETRPTATYPGRGAVLGLLGAALGVRRDDDPGQRRLADAVRVAVKQRSAGSLLRDYHTAQVPPTRRGQQFRTRRDELARPNRELNTILSSRDYRCDGLWTVAVWLAAESDITLMQIQDALRRPYFALYFGRKACPPAAPLAPDIVQASTLREALDHQFEELTRREAQALALDGDALYCWEDEAERLDGNDQGVESSELWDAPLNRRRWQFGPRTEFRRRASYDGQP